MMRNTEFTLCFAAISKFESNGFVKACILVLLAASLSVLLKNFGFKGAPVFIAAVFCAIVSSYGEAFMESVSLLEYVADAADISKYSEACVKVIGIGYLSGISADTCREIGEAGAARCIGIFAKLELIALTIPFIKEIFDSALLFVGE